MMVVVMVDFLRSLVLCRVYRRVSVARRMRVARVVVFRVMRGIFCQVVWVRGTSVATRARAEVRFFVMFLFQGVSCWAQR